jgi:hypothetical protein
MREDDTVPTPAEETPAKRPEGSGARSRPISEARTPTDRDWHTAELPATPQRDFLIPSERWIEAPAALRDLGTDLGISLVAYKRRINRYLLWRAGPARDADARYMAVAADDLDRQFTFRLFPDGFGEGVGPDDRTHTRFRTWKEALRDDRA